MAERRGSYDGGGPRPPLPSEAELSWLWQGQRFPPEALTTADGHTVSVVYPGRRAGGAGPDYRDAVVVVQGRRLLGDVELHVRAASFTAHGHHLDPAYDGLALHVAFADDSGGSVRLASGRAVATASLQPWVERRRDTVQAWLSRPALWSEPCLTAAARLGDDAVDETLRSAGQERLLQRAAELARDIEREGADQALWTALLDALALGGDRPAFARLARALPAEALRATLAEHPAKDMPWIASAALLAVAGLAPPPEGLRLPPAIAAPPASARLRPANRPERRLQAAAALFCRAGGNLPAYALSSLSASASGRELLSAWVVAGLRPGPALCGTARATEVLLHAVLPFAATEGTQRARAVELAAALPALPPYGKTAFLEANLQRRAGRRRPRSVLEQQGLLELHSRWCSQGGCGVCPLS